MYNNIGLLKFTENNVDWNKLLISLFGIDKSGHRMRIVTKMREGFLLFLNSILIFVIKIRFRISNKRRIIFSKI